MKIGVDIGGSHISIGAVGDNNKLILEYEKEIQISKSENPKKTLLESLLILINEMLKELNITQIDKIGIACPRNYSKWKNY